VLYNESSAPRGNNPSLHNFGSDYTLFWIQVRTRLINKVDVAGFCERENDSNTLKLTTWQVLHIVVKECINVERNKNFRFENRRAPRFFKLQVEQLRDATFEFGCNRLRLIGDVKWWHRNIITFVRFNQASEHLNKGRFTCTVLSKHHNCLRRRKRATRYT